MKVWLSDVPRIYPTIAYNLIRRYLQRRTGEGRGKCEVTRRTADKRQLFYSSWSLPLRDEGRRSLCRRSLGCTLIASSNKERHSSPDNFTSYAFGVNDLILKLRMSFAELLVLGFATSLGLLRTRGRPIIAKPQYVCAIAVRRPSNLLL